MRTRNELPLPAALASGFACMVGGFKAMEFGFEAQPASGLFLECFERREAMKVFAFTPSHDAIREFPRVDDFGFGLAGWAGHNWHSELFGTGEKKNP